MYIPVVTIVIIMISNCDCNSLLWISIDLDIFWLIILLTISFLINHLLQPLHQPIQLTPIPVKHLPHIHQKEPTKQLFHHLDDLKKLLASGAHCFQQRKES